MTTKARYAGVIEWFQSHMPVAESELHYGNPYELLVSVILSAQCTDKRVNITTPALFAAFPTPQAMAQATPEEIYPYIKSISYPNNKARNLAGMARMLCEEFGGEVPSDLDQLRRPQDGQCRGGGHLAEGGDAGRYPRIPRFGPHRPEPQCQNTAPDGVATREKHPLPPASAGPPLAHSPRPLCLRRTRSQMRRMWPHPVVQILCGDGCKSGREVSGFVL